MIDRIIKAGASIDYIGPTVKVLGDMIHGGGYTFRIPLCDMVPRDIELMLRRRNVTTWGLLHTGSETMITVREKDAPFAHSCLGGAGIPVLNPPPQAKPKRRERAGSPFKVFDIFDR